MRATSVAGDTFVAVLESCFTSIVLLAANRTPGFVRKAGSFWQVSWEIFMNMKHVGKIDWGWFSFVKLGVALDAVNVTILTETLMWEFGNTPNHGSFKSCRQLRHRT